MPPIPKAYRERRREGYFPLMRRLDEEYQKLSDAHYRAAPKGGSVAVGGGEWVDTFFKMEAIRGCLTALRNLKNLSEAVEEGKAVSSIAVQLWNQKREFQVRRWEETSHAFLIQLVSRLQKEV